MEKVLFKPMDSSDFRTLSILNKWISDLEKKDQSIYADALLREKRKKKAFMSRFFP